MVGGAHPTWMGELRFPKRLHLLRASDFERVFTARHSAANAWFSLHGAANDVNHPRLGLTVSRRVGNAVERNRWKRLAREAFRASQHKLPAVDLVCVARAKTPPTLTQLQELFVALAERIERKIRKSAGTAEKRDA